MERYFERSRLSKNEEKKAYKRIMFITVSSIIFVIAIFFFGFQTLINMAVFISNLNKKPETVINTKKNLLSPPVLEAPYEATNTATIRLKGYSEPKYIVSVYLNEIFYKKFIIPDNGTFSISKVPLIKGKNEIWAIAENQKQKSDKSEILSILYKKDPPKLELKEPEDNSIISNETKTVTISGMTEEVTSLVVNERTIILDDKGNFKYDFPLSDGDNLLEIRAFDEAGNVLKIERKVTYKSP